MDIKTSENYYETTQKNEYLERTNNNQAHKVADFMVTYVKNTQWKQFLFNTIAMDSD